MDSLSAKLEERRPTRLDSPPPSLEQYMEEIGATQFEVAASMGIGLTMIVPSAGI